MSAEGASSEEEVVERLAGNPVHAFHLVKRVTVDWKNLHATEATDHLWKGTGQRDGLTEFLREKKSRFLLLISKGENISLFFRYF